MKWGQGTGNVNTPQMIPSTVRAETTGMESHRLEGFEGYSTGHDFRVDPVCKSPFPRETHICSLSPGPGYPVPIALWSRLPQRPSKRPPPTNSRPGPQPSTTPVLTAPRSGFRPVHMCGLVGTHVCARVCACDHKACGLADQGSLTGGPQSVFSPSCLSASFVSLSLFSSLSFLFLLLTLPSSLSLSLLPVRSPGSSRYRVGPEWPGTSLPTTSTPTQEAHGWRAVGRTRATADAPATPISKLLCFSPRHLPLCQPPDAPSSPHSLPVFLAVLSPSPSLPSRFSGFSRREAGPGHRAESWEMRVPTSGGEEFCPSNEEERELF